MKKYKKAAAKIAILVTEKNKKYGDSFNKTGAILKLLYPNGIKPKDYDNVLAIVRILDKIFRIAADNDKDGESPYQDIAGYALLKSSE